MVEKGTPKGPPSLPRRQGRLIRDWRVWLLVAAVGAILVISLINLVVNLMTYAWLTS